MAGRISKSGKKFAANHSSYTKMAGGLVRALEGNEAVSKISAGIIKTNLPNVGGKKRIKLVDEGSCLLVRLRGNISLQEVRLYGDIAMLEPLVREYCESEGIACGK
jgi:hypothetical protein